MPKKEEKGKKISVRLDLEATKKLDEAKEKGYKIALDIAQQVCYSLSVEYQVCFAVHEDTENLHIHFVFNSSSYLDGKFYCATKEENERLFKFVARVVYFCSEIDLELV